MMGARGGVASLHGNRAIREFFKFISCDQAILLGAQSSTCRAVCQAAGAVIRDAVTPRKRQHAPCAKEKADRGDPLHCEPHTRL